MKPIDAADVIIPPIKGPITPEGMIVWSEAIAGITTLLFPHLIPVPVLLKMREPRWYWRLWWWIGYHGLYQINWWWKGRKVVIKQNRG